MDQKDVLGLKPNLKYDHAYAIVRHDLPALMTGFSIKKVVTDWDFAKAETQRLNSLNGDKALYSLHITRMEMPEEIEQTDPFETTREWCLNILSYERFKNAIDHRILPNNAGEWVQVSSVYLFAGQVDKAKQIPDSLVVSWMPSSNEDKCVAIVFFDQTTLFQTIGLYYKLPEDHSTSPDFVVE